MLHTMLRAGKPTSGGGGGGGTGPLVWTSAGFFTAGRTQLFGFGTNAASWAGGGSTTISGVGTTPGSSYSGTVWSSSTALPTGQTRGGCTGTLTAAIVMGGMGTTGATTGTSWTYNGSAFTSITAAGTKNDTGSAGTQTAALLYGGAVSSTVSTTGQKWNGTAWSAMGALTTARQYVAGFGASDDAMAVGGNSGTVQSSSEKYNGTTWSSSVVFFYTLYAAFSFGASSTAGGVALGYQQANANHNRTYTFNGTTWTLASYAPENNAWGRGYGSSTDAMMVGGAGTIGAAAFPLGTCKLTYTSLLTGGVYSGAPTPSTPRRGAAGIGSQAALIFTCGANGAGAGGQYLTTTEKYDGTSWSAGPAQAATTAYGGSFGTYSAGGTCGGYVTGQGNVTGLFQGFNGTTWSAGGAAATATNYTAGFGTTTAAVMVGGQNTSLVNNANTFKYNGSTWSASGAFPEVRNSHMAAGASSSDGLAGGGVNNSGTNVVLCYLFNGTAWAATGSLPAYRTAGVFLGNSSTSVICSHGQAAATTPYNSYSFNGATWSTIGAPMVYRIKQPTGSTTASSNGLISNGWDGALYYYSTEIYNG